MSEAESKAETKVVAAESEKDDAPKPGEHRLYTPWTFFFDKKLQKGEPYSTWEKNLIKLGTFSTLEGFWRHYANIQAPEQIPRDHDLFLMRHTFVPAWETFPNGGCWFIKVKKRNGTINRLWEELVCACVAELFGEPDVVGVAISTRAKEDVLSVWNKDNSTPDAKYRIGERLKNILNLGSSTQVEYKLFKSAMVDGSSFRNAKAYVYAAPATSSPASAPAAAAPV